MLKCNILDTVIKGTLRIFKACCYIGSSQDFEQYGSGGDDYNPPHNSRILVDFLNGNKKNGVICLYQDNIERAAVPGEKRIYSTDAAGTVLVAQIYLKQDGKILISATSDIDIETTGTVNIDGGVINLGAGGAPVARLGDEVTVDGKKGTITSGGKNTSV